MPEVRVGDGTIWFTVDGRSDGAPMLLSNALGTTVRLWTWALAALIGRFRVIRYDHRGHGRSSTGSDPWSISTLGKDALAVMDAAGVERAHVVGVSLGGMTAMWLGLNAPERIDHLVLANTGARIGSAELWNERIAQVRRDGVDRLVEAALARWLSPGFRARFPGVVEECRSMMQSSSPAGYAGCCEAIRDADLRSEIGDIEAPALVITGTADAATPPASGQFLRERIAGAALLELDAAHLSCVEQPRAFAEAVIDFLEPAEIRDER